MKSPIESMGLPARAGGIGSSLNSQRGFFESLKGALLLTSMKFGTGLIKHVSMCLCMHTHKYGGHVLKAVF